MVELGDTDFMPPTAVGFHDRSAPHTWRPPVSAAHCRKLPGRMPLGHPLSRMTLADVVACRLAGIGGHRANEDYGGAELSCHANIHSISSNRTDLYPAVAGSPSYPVRGTAG